MTTDRKKPGWAFWLTVALVLLPVLYVVSFGPAVWLVRTVDNPGLEDALNVVYAPVRWASAESEWVKHFFMWYSYHCSPAPTQ